MSCVDRARWNRANKNRLAEGINGEVLIQLQQSNLKDMGITSVGHRLTILKAVYNIKLQHNVAIEEDDYVPLCEYLSLCRIRTLLTQVVAAADANAPDAHATQHDVARIIEQITLRDGRIRDLEMDLKSMKDELNRIQDEQRRLREDTLPVIRMAKDKSHPLPTPDGTDPPAISPSATHAQDGKFPQNREAAGRRSKMPWYGNTGSKQTLSPTIHDGPNLEASAAASAAASHLTSSFNSNSDNRSSPHLSSQPSPTSPQYLTSNRANQYSRNDSIATTGPNQPWVDAANPPPGGGSGREAPRSQPPASRREDSRPSPSVSGPSGKDANNSNQSPEANDPTGFMKSFRVSMEEPCYKVLPVALQKYNIHDDPSQYSLYIVHGDQERCLGLEERPLILFKQLATEGKKPMFMLRKHATPVEGFNYTRPETGTGTVRGGLGAPPGSAGTSRTSYASSYNTTQLPGGVL